MCRCLPDDAWCLPPDAVLRPIPPLQVFKALDKDGNARITATEFIKLLKTKVPPAAGEGGSLLQA